MMMKYRKAVKGEIKCKDCRYSHVRSFSKRLQCALFGVSVGAKMTCIQALEKKEVAS